MSAVIGYYNNMTEYIESFVRDDYRFISSLSTPQMVRTNEPNEVLIEIFKGMQKEFETRNSLLFINLEKINFTFHRWKHESNR